MGAAIDFDALAAKHGGTPAVDFDALAAKYGGAIAAPAPTERVSVVSQIPGMAEAPPPTPEADGTVMEKLGAAANVAARTVLGGIAMPIAGWSAMATQGYKGPRAAAEQFSKNMRGMVGEPSTPLEQQYTENVAPVMNALPGLIAGPGVPGALAIKPRLAANELRKGANVGKAEAAAAAEATKVGRCPMRRTRNDKAVPRACSSSMIRIGRAVMDGGRRMVIC